MRSFLLALAVCLAAAPASAQSPGAGDVVVNEIMYDPPPGQPSGNEWIEVVNRSDAPIDLQGLTVSDGGTPSAAVGPSLVVPAGGAAVFVRDATAFAAAYPGVPFTALSGFPSLNNGGDRIALLVRGVELDAVPYQPTWGGADASLERRDPEGPSTVASNFGTSTAAGGGTPGAQNSLFQPDVFPPTLVSVRADGLTGLVVTFSEPVDPATAGVPANYAVGAGGEATPPQSATVLEDPSQVRLAVAGLQDRTTYTLAVSGVTDLRGNAIAPTTVSFFVGTPDVARPGDVVVTEILYDPASGSNGEYVEVHNTTADRVLDLSAIALDGDPIAASLTTLGPGDYVAVVRDLDTFRQSFAETAGRAIQADGAFSLSNSGDTVVLTSGVVTLDSVAFSPTWHRPELDDATGLSLERRDPAGPSNSASNWTSSLDATGGTPGRANSVGLTPGPPLDAAGLQTPAPFAPDEGQAAQIGYRLAGEAALVRVRIFDGAGRLVREIEDGRLSGSQGSAVWDGRGDDGQRLRAGIYVVLLEAVDTVGGRTESYKGAIVLARR